MLWAQNVKAGLTVTVLAWISTHWSLAKQRVL
jgi:hypothetical protein